MAHLIWTEPALNDLEEIAEYIALENTTAARKLIQKMFNTIERLENHPDSGKKPPELEDMSYREVIVNPCRIFYKHENENIYILYVMRAERSLRKYLLEERSKTE